MEPLYMDTPEMRTSPFNQDATHSPSYIVMYIYKSTPEMRTPPLIRSLNSYKGVRNGGVPL